MEESWTDLHETYSSLISAHSHVSGNSDRTTISLAGFRCFFFDTFFSKLFDPNDSTSLTGPALPTCIRGRGLDMERRRRLPNRDLLLAEKNLLLWDEATS